MHKEKKMVSASLDMLEESLIKKLQVLDSIEKENLKQKELLSNPDEADLGELDKIVDVKGELIEQLLILDEGFQSLFDRVKGEVGENKDKYADQIRRMQKLVHDLTDKSASIEAQERRNKALADKYFSLEREKMASGKKSAAVAFNYYQTMNKFKDIPPQFMDKKN